MDFAKLTDSQIYQAISQSYAAIAKLAEYQQFLLFDLGLPTSEIARNQMIEANAKHMERIQKEIDAFLGELTKRRLQK